MNSVCEPACRGDEIQCGNDDDVVPARITAVKPGVSVAIPSWCSVTGRRASRTRPTPFLPRLPLP